MKKKFLSFLALLFCAVNFANAQKTLNDCKLKAEFAFKSDSCTVAYTDKSEAGSGSKITKWYWSLGDGTIDSTQNPKHTYKRSGRYEVCLSIVGTNAAGKTCVDKACHTVEVKGCGSTVDTSKCRLSAKFEAKKDSCTVTFADQSSASTGTTITGWKWSFGDGDSSSVQNPSHTYTHSGHFMVCLTITGKNAAGKVCFDRECEAVDIKGCGSSTDSTRCRLSAKFEDKKDSCTVSFLDHSVASTGTTITSWKWSFGDGDSSIVQNPSHTYAHSGHYMVCLTITGKNAAGKVCFDRECRPIDIRGCGSSIDSAKCRLHAKFDAKKDSCTVTFVDRSAASPGTTITSWKWSFGDGDSSTVQNPSHTYTHSGHYMACLTITGTNAAGKVCFDRACHPIEVKGCGSSNDSTRCRLHAKFDSKADSCTIAFVDHSSTISGTTITSWKWKFGDGDSSSVQNPTHVYAHSGNYFVCLTITGTNAAGKTCVDRECRPVFLKGCTIDSAACRLHAEFDADKDSTTVKFKDQSKAINGTTITKWYWSFGDGAVDSTSQNPTHTYAKKGAYKVCLTVIGTNLLGKQCKDTECETVEVGRKHREEGQGATASSISTVKLYPNPANEVVNINFKVETAGQVNITVTDIQGRVLSVVEDANMAIGTHNVEWNVNVNSGLYIVTIKTAAGIEQKQLLIQQ